MDGHAMERKVGDEGTIAQTFSHGQRGNDILS
jgi:hypothetical protein